LLVHPGETIGDPKDCRAFKMFDLSGDRFDLRPEFRVGEHGV
jgi:hypothetical protein